MIKEHVVITPESAIEKGLLGGSLSKKKILSILEIYEKCLKAKLERGDSYSFAGGIVFITRGKSIVNINLNVIFDNRDGCFASKKLMIGANDEYVEKLNEKTYIEKLKYPSA